MKVVALDPKANARREVVEMAQLIIKLAEDGKLTDLTWCACRADGGVETGYTPTDDQWRRISAVSRLLHRLHVSADESADVTE